MMYDIELKSGIKRILPIVCLAVKCISKYLQIVYNESSIIHRVNVVISGEMESLKSYYHFLKLFLPRNF